MAEAEEVKQFKLLAGITDANNDELFVFLIDTVRQNVLNYINHETLPAELDKVFLLICVSYYKTSGLGKTTSEESGALNKVKRGDTEYSYSTIASSAFSLLDSNDFFGYRTALNPFRKLRW